MMQPLHNERAEQRVRWLARTAMVWIAVLGVRLVQLQIIDHDRLARLAEKQQTRKAQVATPRAAIFDGSNVPLALTVPAESVSVKSRDLPEDLDTVTALFSSVFGWNAERRIAMRSALQQARDAKSFLWIERGISLDQSERLRAMNLKYVEFEPDARREYPAGTLASHVVGGVAQAEVDPQRKVWAEVGAWGVERKYQSRLAGRDGQLLLRVDSKAKGFEKQVQVPAQAGEAVYLTIDRRIQYLAERAIAKAVREHHAESGSIVVMRPGTGEVLAVANAPTFDPNTAPSKGELRWRKNIAVEESFEPGSVFKIVTLAAALDLGRVAPHSGFDCGHGRFELFKRIIHDHVPHGWLTAREILAKSSNIGAIKIGMTMKREEFLSYIHGFGFGRRTGIELPAESGGLVWPAKRWTPVSIGSVAMGHELRATPLQLAQAVSVIANNGRRVRPTVTRGPRIQKIAYTQDGQVVKPETALTMRRLMEEVVVHPSGTGRAAKLDGYTSAGKTGSAQVIENGRYVHGKYNSSFAGFAPVNNPQIVVVVTLNQITRLAGLAAAPVFREVAMPTLELLDVPKDLPDRVSTPVTPPATPVSDLALSDLADPALASAPEENEEDEEEELPGSRTVPDFRGMSMRAAQAKAVEENWPLEFTGSGLVRQQTPAAGRTLRPGAVLRLHFSR